MLKVTQFPAAYPNQSRTSGPVTPAMQFTPHKAPGQLSTDQVHFGAHHPDMPFRQDHNLPTAGTKKNPISPNNCLVCSVKNLLAYYGHAPETVDNCIQEILTTEAKDPHNQLKYAPMYQNGNAVELNNNFVLECLTDTKGGLNMRIKPYHINDRDQIEAAIDERLPFFVFASGGHGEGKDSKTLASHNLTMDHAYTVIPNRADNNNQEWKILDPWQERPTIIKTSRELKDNLSKMTSESSLYCIARKGPDKDRVEVYAKPPTKPDKTEPTPTTPTTKPGKTEIKQEEPTIQPIKTDSTTLIPPITQAEKTDSTELKPPTTQAEKTELKLEKTDSKPATPSIKPNSTEKSPLKESSAKKGMFTRLTDWFKRQWQKVVNAFKRFGRWLKKPFSSK